MEFKKGDDPRRNLKGRPKGTPNKSSEDLRALVQKFIDSNWFRIERDFNSLDPLQRLNFIEKLLKYVLPAPLHELERLSDEDLDRIIDRLKNNINNN